MVYDEFGRQEGCFIATVTYGSPLAEELNVLRGFRNNVLYKNILGRLFVKTYYRCSPPVAKYISTKEHLQYICRCLLNPIVKILKKQK